MTPLHVYLGTEDGLYAYNVGDERPVGPAAATDGNAVRAIAVHPERHGVALVGCGLRGRGLYRTADGGRTAEPVGFDDAWVWGALFDPSDPERVYVGTEPPAVHVSDDGGETFERADGLDSLDSRSDWTFFHEPFHAGHVHGFAVHPDRPARVFAGVEHGAFVYSHDAGETWHEALVGHDLHRAEVDPSDPDRVLAGAGGGLFESRDAGATWTAVEPLRGTYVHGIEFDPDDADRIYVYVDDRATPLHRSDDGGERWRAIGSDLPAARPADTLTTHPTAPDILLYAGDTGTGSALYASEDAGETWRTLVSDLPKTWRVQVERAR